MFKINDLIKKAHKLDKRTKDIIIILFSIILILLLIVVWFYYLGTIF